MKIYAVIDSNGEVVEGGPEDGPLVSTTPRDLRERILWAKDMWWEKIPFGLQVKTFEEVKAPEKSLQDFLSKKYD
ncbi:MAG: hypothetical protein HC888_03355 [Candidatus Competibacteraceae bacterium]|nr:hypothetical protein [Candidatus Competibacteraceae bacterium]